MRLLVPLGLLGLIGLIILLIIYIIKPNYQQKYISSTYIWKLSLKYRKKRIPISQLRNILLIICQVLTIICCTAILSKPANILKSEITVPEVIIVLDSSASMRAQHNEKTRYERAVDTAIELANKTYDNDGIVSVIIADTEPEVLASRYDVSRRGDLITMLSNIYPEDCSFGVSDIDAAIAKCDGIFEENPAAKIHVITDTDYDYIPDEVIVDNVSLSSEWNIAILSATAESEDNYFVYRVEIVSYGVGTSVTLRATIKGCNADSSEDAGDNYDFEVVIDCPQNEVQTVVFKYFGENSSLNPSDLNAENLTFVAIPDNKKIYSYQSAIIKIEGGQEVDSLEMDDTYFIYGGQKELLNVYYYSYIGGRSSSNIFVNTALASVANYYSDRWDMQVHEEKKYGAEPATKGYDVYIYEHTMPDEMPSDGAVILLDPDDAPRGAGFRLSYNAYNDTSNPKYLTYFEGSAKHDLLDLIDVEEVFATRYSRLTVTDSMYETLAVTGNDPMLIVKNYRSDRVAVMPFSVHYSNVTMKPMFPFVLRNLFDYFLPPTINGNAFEVYETVTLNSRGEDLRVVGGTDGVDAFDETYTDFPAQLHLTRPGTYTMTHTTFSGKYRIHEIFVTIPKVESNICVRGGAIKDPYIVVDDSTYFKDLLLYIAIALTALLFAEWILQAIDNM